MKTALKILSDEHQNILKVIDVLQKECELLQAGKAIDKIFWNKAVDFITGYADKFHHAKEEDLLFKEFNKCAEEGRVHCNPVNQMLYEHDLGRNFVKGLKKGILENNKEKIIANAEGYANLLSDHIFKEDNILYPMIDEALDDKIKNKLLLKFKLAEQKLNKEEKKHLLLINILLRF